MGMPQSTKDKIINKLLSEFISMGEYYKDKITASDIVEEVELAVEMEGFEPERVKEDIDEMVSEIITVLESEGYRVE